MTYDLNIIATHITNTLNSDQTYQPVTFEHVLLVVRGVENVKPPRGNTDKFIQRVIDAIPRIPKSFTLEYLISHLPTRTLHNTPGLFSIVELYPFVMSDLNRVKFALASENICKKFEKDEYHSASRPTQFKQYSVDDLEEILDTLFQHNIIKSNPIKNHDTI